MRGNSSGRSMVEMLGVLAIVGVLSIGAMVGYTKAIMKWRVNRTIDEVIMVLRNYANISVRNTKGINISGAEAVSDATKMGLSSDCSVETSGVHSGYKVCKVPVGEMYVKYTGFTSEDVSGDFRSFMLFVSVPGNDPSTCTEFLKFDWKSAISEEMWNMGMLWLASNSSEKVILSEGGQDVISRKFVKSSCKTVCGTSNGEFCTIVFDFMGG